MYALLLSMVFANILFIGLGYILLKPFAKAIQAKKAFLIPIILGLAFVGTLSTGIYTDVVIMVIVGFCSYILRKLRFDLAPLVIAFVLSEPIEYRFSQTLLYAKGSVFHYLFVQRPVTSAFLLASLIWIAYLIFRPWLRGRRGLLSRRSI